MGIAFSSPYLETPNTEKISETGADHELNWAVCSMQGWRKNMEDSHVAEGRTNENDSAAVFAVFDGHGGREVALFCEKYFPIEIKQSEPYKKGDYGQAIVDTFHLMDTMIPADKHKSEIDSYRHPSEAPAPVAGSGNEEEKEGSNKDPAVEKLFSIIKQLSEQKNPADPTAKEIDDKIEEVSKDIEVDEEKDMDVEEKEDEKEEASANVEEEEDTKMKEDVVEPETEIKGKEMEEEDDDEEEIIEEFEADDDDNKASAFGNGREYCTLPDHEIQAGCTAVVVVVDKENITVGWAGDSRAVLSQDGKAVTLSVDHKPNDDVERTRIENAGGFVQNVSGQHRVNGNLNLSRALGDLKYKQNNKLKPADQIITAEPDLVVTKRSPNDEFIIVACDGVWDVMTNQDAVDFVSLRIKEKGKSPEALKEINEQLLDACISSNPTETKGIGCDNMTSIILTF